MLFIIADVFGDMKKFFDDLKSNVHVGAKGRQLQQQQPDYSQDPAAPIGE